MDKVNDCSRFKIEQGVEMPKNQSGRPKLYPFHEMQTGDSFFIPLNGKTAAGAQRNVLSCAKKQGFLVSTRQVTENGSSGVRVWRK